MKPIFVLNGPNLNLIGEREPEIYGAQTLSQIEQRLKQQAIEAGFELSFRQTNHEGILVDWIQEARLSACALILNAASYTHTSVAIHDALRTLSLPIIEVHLSNIFRREPFRHHSYVSSVAGGVICGFGAESYRLALSAAISLISDSVSASSTRSVNV